MSTSSPPSSSTPGGRAPLWGPVLCGAAMATVGTSVVASKLIGVQIEPFAATALRHLLALPVLLLLCVLFRPAWPRPDRRDAWILLMQAASGSVGYTALLIAGTAMVSAADAGVVTGTLPAMAALFAIVILGERPGVAALLGIALATAGVLLLSAGVGAGQGKQLPHRGLGIGLVTAAVACEVIFILGQRRLRSTIEPLAMATLMSAGGLLLSLPAAAVAWALGSPRPALGASGQWSALAAIAWYAWVPTVIGFWLWYAGARRATATQAALSTAWLPVVAVIGAAAVLGEALTPTQLMALGLVLAGALVGARPPHQPLEPGPPLNGPTSSGVTQPP
ncbi:DMT family transporter [Aquincola tertiaricarbonis]|uniref:DMT family transporter n=1 Tax=Aquincola tertiaricarbonis TaxID=391953 RepID=A0ABY4S2M1_AQUTE|nr:DMT family transporter [Aquincola tertiaricarbonis]URI05928.1 DMT family transporter [Aquincola tertiaricarbonis]